MKPVVLAAAPLLLAASASAGATGAARPSVALTASPARVTLEGSGRTTVRVSNAGAERVVVDVTRAGLALDLRGRPKIVSPHRSRLATAWLRVRPRRFVLPPGRNVPLSVAARPPRGAEPGDHGALVVLTTRRRGHGRIAVRMRLGVVVNVRISGRVVHGLGLRGINVRRQARSRVIEVLVRNRGNVTEELDAGRISLSLSLGGHAVASVRPEPRELLPRTRGYVLFRYRGPARGVVSGVVRLWPEPGGTGVSRVFRLRL